MARGQALVQDGRRFEHRQARKEHGMSVFDLSVTDALLSTTRAVRKRLDLERPVPKEVIRECLELTLQAPTGSNRQGWRWIVVTEAETRGALAEIYRKGTGSYLDDAHRDAVAAGAAQDARVFESARYLAEHLQDVPVHVIPCIRVDHLPADPPPRVWAGVMGSIMPAVWSFQLALRARGLGSALTTLHLGYADEAAALLGIPDGIMQAGLLPVAYTIGTDFKPAKRPPLDEITHWERW
jgi:nitroreductase